MKVFFDARYTTYPNHDGVSRYGSELLREVLRMRNDVTAIIHTKDQLQNLPENVPYVILNAPTSAKEPFIARELNKLGADVVFSPLQTMGARGKKYKLILTIHDLIYYTYPTPPKFSPAIRVLWRLFHLTYIPERYLLNRADAVVAVSKMTKEDMQTHRLTKNDITVIPNAVDTSAFTAMKADEAEFQASSHTLVYMGSFLPYKNVDTLVRAMSLLPDYSLYLCSKISDEEKLRLKNLSDNPNLFFENGATDARYRELLGSATALVTASKFEGFGIPLLEAQAAGTPVVCSDIPIFHEVAAKSALYFDPTSSEDFAKKVITLEDAATRKDLVRHGKTNVRRYGWQKSARKLSNLIDSLAK